MASNRLAYSISRRALVAQVCLILSACAPLGDEELGQPELRTQAINGGTITAARPEVGQYLVDVDGDGVFNTCTATMISSTWFLTAGHCLDWKARVSGGIFRLHGVAGLLPWVDLQVVDTFTLGFGLGTPDVAVGRVFTPLPSSVTPAHISRFHAAAQDAVTLMGFGCDEQAPPNEQLKKRFLQTTMGGTGRLCQGDSGGPAFLGSLADNGDIVAVHSDGNPDRFGDPVIYKEFSEAVMRQTVNGHEKDLDRPGGDYSSSLLPAGSNATSCETRCRSDARCRAWTYRLSDRKCWLKSFVRDTTPLSGVFSGLGLLPSPATDRFGSDYTTYPVARTEICEADCARDANCASYTVFNGNCSLKNAIPSATACASCSSGNRKGIEQDTDRQGSDYNHFSSTSAFSCANECAKDARCAAFSFVHATGVCWLKDHVTRPSAQTGVSSGVRRGYEFNVFRPGNDIDVIWLDDRKPWVCQAACARNSRCRAWSMTIRASARCILKDGNPAGESQDDSVSGRKGMEFF